MDGNNRYGRQHHLHDGGGHVAGKDQLDLITQHARKVGVEVLTVFAFSSENWRRPPDEVALLMQLFEQVVQDQVPRMLEQNIAMRFIGDRSKMTERLQHLMQAAEEVTAPNAQMIMVIAISYGGLWDMAQAAKRLALAVQAGKMSVDEIDEVSMQQQVEMGDLPPVDLLIRTGGEYRLSNFVLWQSAYAELYFTDTLWPAFDEAEFDRALGQFSFRERRFGRTSEQVLEHETNHKPNNLINNQNNYHYLDQVKKHV
ncbi:MAG: di-trans,poly-cis-decaprenylcistransferase [Candidatus Saccharibacteria bacterium]|nr:di-trans,poly-cis-decaprenylcistransferase [Moraxellaceae bacterium]